MNKKAKNAIIGAKTKEQKTAHYYRQELTKALSRMKVLEQARALLMRQIDKNNQTVSERLENATEASEAIVRLRKDYEQVCTENAYALEFLNRKGLLKEFMNILNPPIKEKPIDPMDDERNFIGEDEHGTGTGAEFAEEVAMTETEAKEEGLTIVDEDNIPIEERELGGEG